MAESKKGATSSHTISAKGGCLQHNRRTQVSQNVFPERTKLNVCWESEKIANCKQIQTLKKHAAKLYTEKQHQKCQKSFTPYRETVVVIKDSSTLKEAQNYARMVESETGMECVGIWIHKDEGHYRSKYIEGDQDFKCNAHAHFLWYCQNPNTGKSIPLKRQHFSQMQDWAAEAFGMERGNSATLTDAEYMNMAQFKRQAMEKDLDSLSEAMKECEDVRAELLQLQQQLNSLETKKKSRKSFPRQQRSFTA